jgi:hypothetical protein
LFEASLVGQRWATLGWAAGPAGQAGFAQLGWAWPAWFGRSCVEQWLAVCVTLFTGVNPFIGMMPNRKPLIEKLEQQSPLNFRVDFWEAIVIACVAADIF